MERGGVARAEAKNSGKLEGTSEATEAKANRDAEAVERGKGVGQGRGEIEG